METAGKVGPASGGSGMESANPIIELMFYNVKGNYSPGCGNPIKFGKIVGK